ncbi:hypothetical protein IKE82_02750 [Candidatus Saccharibacteria bacterium]|nr:hypothetical protein [Candidatus Saccharibacteria bacterium]
MQKTENTGKVARRKVGSSTTLNRKYVKRPAKSMEPTVAATTERSVKIRRFYNPSNSIAEPTAMNRNSMINMRVAASTMALDTQSMNTEPQVSGGVEPHPLQEVANLRMRARKNTIKKEKKMTAKELKDKAIKEALAAASATGAASTDSKVGKKKKSKSPKMHFGFGRVVLALSCAAVAVFAIAYFVNLNMPDVSLKVAAMQTGIDATYPNYVPRNYALSSITSENKKIVLDFKSAENDGAFTLVEETSSWDSSALLSNYVKETYGENYQVVKEQGLTLYISGSNAAWVNGGIVYKITTNKGSLTNKQIKAIATSL